MTHRPTWASSDIDMERPNAARIYDYLLGGEHNFPADRAMADRLVEVMPDVRAQALANRHFLRRAVRFCAAAGVRQFLDLGSGIPTQANVHEVARASDPHARVVYVDVDPIAVAHSRALLADRPGLAAIQADLRDPRVIIDHPAVHDVIDFDAPVALLFVAVLHAIADADDPGRILSEFTAVLAPGSLLVVAHGTDEGAPEIAARMRALSAGTATPLHLRGRAAVEAFFAGLEIVPPGVTWVPLWRPDGDPPDPQRAARSNNYGGVGRKA